jgi:hypothetical protein
MIKVSISNNMNKINITVNYVLKYSPRLQKNYVGGIFLELV